MLIGGAPDRAPSTARERPGCAGQLATGNNPALLPESGLSAAFSGSTGSESRMRLEIPAKQPPLVVVADDGQHWFLELNPSGEWVGSSALAWR
jgi:hypothetical protein